MAWGAGAVIVPQSADAGSAGAAAGAGRSGAVAAGREVSAALGFGAAGGGCGRVAGCDRKGRIALTTSSGVA